MIYDTAVIRYSTASPRWWLSTASYLTCFFLSATAPSLTYFWWSDLSQLIVYRCDWTVLFAGYYEAISHQPTALPLSYAVQLILSNALLELAASEYGDFRLLALGELWYVLRSARELEIRNTEGSQITLPSLGVPRLHHTRRASTRVNVQESFLDRKHFIGVYSCRVSSVCNTLWFYLMLFLFLSYFL